MKLVHKYDFKESKFSLYFMERQRDTKQMNVEVASKDSERYLWNTSCVCVEFTHNWDTEDTYTPNNGNKEPHRGFGHIAFNTNNVIEACNKLENNGVKFHKKPQEGTMKGIAFALDPDGYWIEIVGRSYDNVCVYEEEFNLSQTMIRVTHPLKSIQFYTDFLNMTLVCVRTFKDFSLYFLACISDDMQRPDPYSDESIIFMKQLWEPVLELTHNHDTPADFKYHNGNIDPTGYGHTAFVVYDLDIISTHMVNMGVLFKKLPHEGKMRGIAFVYDVDGYCVELVQRGIEI
eukprot:GHVR01152210.1.p1 GENE.GHVR01152210.1~~GHVR01152210.1.p1  ORF type:complete len:289 (+),score=52.80 GHVR01152210.1:201-1067(+)